jgi:hypothetical protein
MQQSSGSIGSLAAALARAQVELINPEKSMVATIRPESRGAAEQIFRYAPLSDGLNMERVWWEKTGIDPNVAARSLWLQSHPTRSI